MPPPEAAADSPATSETRTLARELPVDGDDGGDNGDQAWTHLAPWSVAAWSLAWADGLLVALAGVGVGATAHALAHWLDRELGGSPADPWYLSALAVVLLAVLQETRLCRQQGVPPRHRSRRWRRAAAPPGEVGIPGL